VQTPKKGSPEINRLLSTKESHNIDVKKGTSRKSLCWFFSTV